jgi:hypothetical protein
VTSFARIATRPSAAPKVWQECLPQHGRALRRFFTILEECLYADKTWGPILDRYQQCRFRREVQEKLRARNLDLSARELVYRVSAHLSGSGAIAMSGGTAAGAGGVAVAGNVGQIVMQQIIMRSGMRADWAALRKRYLNRLCSHCCAFPLAALGGEVEPQKVVTLDQVYIELNTTVNLPERLLEQIQRGEVQEWSQLRDQLGDW